jgi:hypothetical protein
MCHERFVGTSTMFAVSAKVTYRGHAARRTKRGPTYPVRREVSNPHPNNSTPCLPSPLSNELSYTSYQKLQPSVRHQLSLEYQTVP